MTHKIIVIRNTQSAELLGHIKKRERLNKLILKFKMSLNEAIHPQVRNWHSRMSLLSASNTYIS